MYRNLRNKRRNLHFTITRNTDHYVSPSQMCLETYRSVQHRLLVMHELAIRLKASVSPRSYRNKIITQKCVITQNICTEVLKSFK